MKKAILLLAAIAAMTIGARAQWFDLSNNNERATIGIQVGQSASGTEYANIGGGASIDIYGVQVGFLYSPAEHKYDNHVTQTLYNDSASYNITVGYGIPVLPWLRVMPLVGYSQTNYGITDASTVNIETNENSSSMYHDYTVTDGSRKHYFNFGVGLNVQPLPWLGVYGVYSSRAIYGGIYVNLGAFMDKVE